MSNLPTSQMDNAIKISADPALQYNEWRILPIVTLTSIATIIGSGILALPVTLAETPLTVFLLLFTLAMIAQIGVIYAVVELLQRASASIQSNIRTQTENPSTYDSVTRPEHHMKAVSLFSVSRLFLPNNFLRFVFILSTFLGFVAIIVSYGLAGPQAVWQLASRASDMAPPPSYIFTAYWLLGTIGVIFFLDVLLTVFSSLTVLKGILFVGVIAIVAALPAAARIASIPSLFADINGWENSATPFLVSCVALGGLANTTPVTFALLPPKPTRSQMINYRRAVVAAIVICYLLNVGWVLAILAVVPRTGAPGEVSLAVASAEGQISTVPLIAALYAGNTVQGSLLSAIEITVELFIVVSTAVSFFVMSAGLRSFLDGAAANVSAAFLSSVPAPARKWLPRAIGYIASFGLILGLVLSNPKGFISMIAGFSSFTINLQAGAMLFVALYFSRRMNDQLSTLPTASVPGSSKDAAPVAPQVVADPIPLEMTSNLANTWIIFGTIFFSSACLLAALGPFLGINIGGHE